MTSRNEYPGISSDVRPKVRGPDDDAFVETFRRARVRQDLTPADALWEQADAAFALRSLWRSKTASELAAANGLSPSYIRQLIRTADAFPLNIRRRDLSFTHHKLAAMTDAPARWLALAAANGWSKREMAEAIRVDRHGAPQPPT